MREWRCIDCGHEVIAPDNPTGGIFDRWSDGHKCKFKEAEE